MNTPADTEARVAALLQDALDEPDCAAAMLWALAVPGRAAAHVGDEAIAALIDGRLDGVVVAHLAQCHHCAAAYATCAAALGAPAPPLLWAPPLGLSAGSRVPHLLATVAVDGGRPRVHACSGAARVQPALSTRGARALEAVSLRDAAEAAAFEVALLGGGAARVSLLVRWLGAGAAGLTARAVRAGRLLAEHPLEGGSALLSNLAAKDLRLDLRRDDTLVAVAWLRFEEA